MSKRVETVAIVYRHPRILLGEKKKKLGAGRYNGYGGGMESFDKTIYDTAKRETLEEIGIELINPERMGRILFHFQTAEQDHDVHFFQARRYRGTPTETDEMTAKWFHIDDIPYGNMWKDDAYWLPIMLRGNRFLGEFLFNEKHEIIQHEIDEYKSKKFFEEALKRVSDI